MCRKTLVFESTRHEHERSLMDICLDPSIHNVLSGV